MARCVPTLPGVRADVHDAAVAALDHSWEDGMSAVQSAVQDDVGDGPPELRIRVMESAEEGGAFAFAGGGKAGVVHEDIDRVRVRARRRDHHLLHRCGIGDIAGHGQGP